MLRNKKRNMVVTTATLMGIGLFALKSALSGAISWAAWRILDWCRSWWKKKD